MRFIERWLTRWHNRQHGPPVIIKFHGTLTEEQVHEIRDRLHRLYRQEGRNLG